MYKYELSDSINSNKVLQHVQDYLLEKERWLVVRDFSDVNYANQCSVLKE